MVNSTWAYPHEKFYVARRALLLPHPNGEPDSIVCALGECMHGLRGVSRESIADEDARECFDEIQRAMDTNGVEDPEGIGTWAIKARNMTTEERAKFAEAVDHLATWFSRRFWGLDQ